MSCTVGSRTHTGNIHLCKAPGSSTEEGTLHEHLLPYTHTQQKTSADIYTDIHTVKYTAFFLSWKKISLGADCLGSGEVDAFNPKALQVNRLPYIHSCKARTHTKKEG